MTVDEMLRDLRSVKMRSSERTHVNDLRVRFQVLGAVTPLDERWLRDICRRYGIQLRMLHESRERARHTNALRSMGISTSDAAERADVRMKQMESEGNDLGF